MKTLRVVAALLLACGLTVGAQAQDDLEQDVSTKLEDALASTIRVLKDAATGLATALEYAALPACADLDSNNLLVHDLGDALTSGALYCREIAGDGEFLINPGAIGNQGVIERGVRQAYDVFGLTVEGIAVERFDHAITICLQGRGAMIFLPAFASPRPPQTPQSYASGGYTCARVGSPGIMALVGG